MTEPQRRRMSPPQVERTTANVNVDEGDNTEDGDEQIENVIVDVENDNEEDNDGEGGKDVDGEDDKGNFESKKREKISKVHDDFIEVASNYGSVKLQCVHCKSLLMLY
ncbi:hypothetical protein ACS0TY_013244 [Phlomoides rotata]